MSISINEITNELLTEYSTKTIKRPNFRAILSEQEHKLIKIIQENHQGLKSVLIKFFDGKYKMIEVTKAKKTRTAKLLTHHFTRGEYKQVRILVENGKTAYIEETIKQKL